jgi:hypothetical protein
MTVVTIILDGPRGAKYRLCASQLHKARDGADGVHWRLQKQISSKRSGVSWSDVANASEETNDPGSRILAGWLLTPMPLKNLGELFKEQEDAAVAKDYNT